MVLLGGGFMLVALISLIWVKNYGIAWSAFLTGSAILAGAFTLKLFWVQLAWITLVGALLILIFALLHNKKLIVNVVKDIADDGKVNHSAKSDYGEKYDYNFLVNTFVVIVAATLPVISWGIYTELKESNRTQSAHTVLLADNLEEHKTLTEGIKELRSTDKCFNKRLSRVEMRRRV